ncbi:MAG: hypothetical protein KY468_07240 [Armatimonadetes bacterium]|nr:hypothetical protein [Armatimonadota bacterium]
MTGRNSPSARPTTRLRILLYLPAALLALAGAASGGVRLMNLAAETDHASRPHDHRSAHGGLVQVVGRGHVEAVRETGGRVRLYALGEDEAVLNPIPIREIRADALPDGGLEAHPVTLRAEPQPGEAAGQASVFAGTLPPEIARAPVTLSLTLPLEGRLHRVRLRLGYGNAPSGHDDSHASEDMHDPEGSLAANGNGEKTEAPDPAMPAAAPSDAQERLYRTAGGLYTKADIRANGTAPPAEKYKGVMAKHILRPAPGDRVCPITNTKANPRFAWVVNGKTYRFCCPPCIDEFVHRAKTSPSDIRPPEAYVHKVIDKK